MTSYDGIIHDGVKWIEETNPPDMHCVARIPMEKWSQDFENQLRERMRYELSKPPKKQHEMGQVFQDMRELEEIEKSAIRGAERAKQILKNYQKPFYSLFK